MSTFFWYFLINDVISLREALQMSMQENSQSDASKVLEDQSFVSSILTNVSFACVKVRPKSVAALVKTVLISHFSGSFPELTPMILQSKIFSHLCKVNLRCV